eukprot:2248945-Amphidinium_carterae.2
MLSTEGFLDAPMTPAEQDALSLPRLGMRTHDWVELSRKMVQIGLCCLADDRECPTWGSQKRHLRAGIFGVAKPESTELRLIIDRRRKNSTERSLRKGLKCLHSMGLVEDARYYELLRHMTLPHASQFTDLLLPRECQFLMSIMDCKDFFYLLRMPHRAVMATAVGVPVSRSHFLDLDLPSDRVLCDLNTDETCTLFLRAPAMGDLKSVEIAQAAHASVLRKAGMKDTQWLTFMSQPPTDSCWEGCYVDDYFQGVVVPTPSADPKGTTRAMSERWSDLKLADTCAGYDDASFVIKHSKSRLRKTHVTVWGGEIQSEGGWVAGSREKLDRLLYTTHRLLLRKGRAVPAKLLEQLIGHWVHQLTFQRLGMCLLDDVYQVLHSRRLNKKMAVLTKGAQDELLSLVSLWPLFTCDLRRPPAPLIAASDATTRRGGAVVGPLTAEESTWLWARLPRRPGAVSWRSAENVLEVLQKAPVDEGHEALETFVSSHGLEEMVAARSLVKWVTRRAELHSCRLPVLVDNLILSGWVRSEFNPSDDPTRLARLRAPLVRPEPLVTEIANIADTMPYPFQAVLAMWGVRGWENRPADHLFDSTLGYPGEGPRLQWPGQTLDHRNSDLRVRVQPATVKRYGVQLSSLESWALDTQKLEPSQLWGLTGEQLCSCLCAFVQHQYISGIPFQHGLDLLAGVQMIRPDASLAIRPAWQMQRQWSRLTPVGTRPPMPQQLILALAAAAATLGLRRVAAVIVLMFHCLLRPSEAATCQRCQLLLPADIAPGSREAAVALPQTKTADRGARA